MPTGECQADAVCQVLRGHRLEHALYHLRESWFKRNGGAWPEDLPPKTYDFDRLRPDGTMNG